MTITHSLILIILLCVSVMSCSKEFSPKMLIVEFPIKVYRTYQGDSLEEIFTLVPGDRCTVGREETQKTFEYLEVVCPGKGYGWIINKNSYKIIDKTNVSKTK